VNVYYSVTENGRKIEKYLFEKYLKAKRLIIKANLIIVNFLNIWACIISREPVILHHVKRNELYKWFNSSVGSEHLPYKQGVQGSNPC
jgi:hypothetical protein